MSESSYNVYAKRYYENHKEVISEKMSKYYTEWYAKNKEAICAKKREARAKKRAEREAEKNETPGVA
jgi:hypothetical protein